MTQVETVAGAMARWFFHAHEAGRFAAGPQGRRAAAEAIADVMGCLYAGRGDVTVQRTASVVPQGSGSAALITGGTADAAFAAMLNATAAHVLDFDDNFLPGMSHASAVILPALLAVAGPKTRGADLIDAYLVALQAQAFVGAGLGGAHYTAGWHGTSTVGSVGTAVGVAWLLGADEEALRRSLTLACSFACGTKGQFGTPAKPFHAGLAARNAVEAARLAIAGLEGHAQAFEGPQGLAEMFRGEGTPGYAVEQIRDTRLHIIESVGLAPKLHPCCGSTHLIIDALSDLRARHAIDPDRITRIDAHVGIANRRNLPYSLPENEMEARFSMHYCLARALRRGRTELADFTPKAVLRLRDDPLAKCLELTSYSPQEEAACPPGQRLPHILRLHFADGTVLQAERRAANGTLDHPFPEGAMRDKFTDCCGGASWAGPLYEALRGLDRWPDLTPAAVLFGGSHSPH